MAVGSSSPILTVLGIAQDGGHPQAGCQRSCCAAQWAGQAPGHRVASLGLQLGEQRWLVDCTPDFPAQLAALGGPPLDGILLTHAHMGHYTGLLQLGAEAWAAPHVPLYVMPGMRRFLEGNAPWSALIRARHVAVRELVANRPVELAPGLVITPWHVPHRGPWTETVAFHIEGPARRVLFVPDVDRWETWERDICDVVSELDIAYVDGSFFDPSELPWRRPEEILHPTVRHTMNVLGALPEAIRGRVRFLHLNHTNPLLRRQSPEWREVHERGFHVAREGEQVVL